MSVSEDGPSNREFGTTCFSDAEKDITTDTAPTQDHHYVEVPTIFPLSEYKEAAIAYIAGCVTRMVMKKTRCASCQEALLVTDAKGTSFSSFMLKKDRGGLIYPTETKVF